MERGIGRRSVRACALGLVLALAAVGVGNADTYVGAGAGALVPYEGKTGYTFLGEIGGRYWSKYFRLGGEFQYTRLDHHVDLGALGAGSIAADIRTYELRALLRFFFRPDRISPYLGGGGGFAVMDVDDSSLRRALGGVSPLGSSDVAVGGGLIGLAGIEIPLFSKHVNLFAEARVDYTWEFTSNLEPLIGPKSYSGFTGIGGLRTRF